MALLGRLPKKHHSTPVAFRRALEDRLLAISKAKGTDLQRMHRQGAFDRLLALLVGEDNPSWLLKGGYVLALARTTKDLNLGNGSV